MAEEMVRGTTELDKRLEEDPLSAFAAEPPSQNDDRSGRLGRSDRSSRADRSSRSVALESFDRFAEFVAYAVRRSDRFKREIPSRYRQCRREYLEPFHERVRAIRVIPVLAASAAGAALAVGTVAALNAVWALSAVPSERAASIADDRTVAIPLSTVTQPLQQAVGVEPIDSFLEAARAPHVAAATDQLTDTRENRLDAVVAPFPTASRQVVVEESEEASASTVQSATATSGVATVATPPGAVTPIVAVPGAVAASAAPALPLPSSPRGVMATAAIESVLGRYASAFSALDARSAKTVWPSVNERNLERAFSSLDRQEFDLGSCDINVTPPRAVATCDGSARYVPKVGNKTLRSERTRWTFRLQQSGPDWMIEAVDTR